MYVLALTQSAPLTDDEVARIASDLATTPYEARLTLTGGLPAILLTAAELGRVAAVGERMRARGHSVLLLDASQVTPADQMTPLKRFRFEEHGVLADDSRADLLPYDDVMALVRAVQKTRTDTLDKVQELKFNAARAAVLGPMFAMQRRTTETKKSIEERENVVYLFRLSGERPWLLSENGAHYAGLGPGWRPPES